MPNQTPLRTLGMFGSIGLQLAIWIVAGLGIGRWLDRVMGTAPIFLIIGIISGLLLGIIGMIALIKRFLGDGS